MNFTVRFSLVRVRNDFYKNIIITHYSIDEFFICLISLNILLFKLEIGYFKLKLTKLKLKEISILFKIINEEY